MSHTIPEITADANALFTQLTADMAVDLSLPALTFDTDFTAPPEVGNPAYETVTPIDVAALTSGTVEGTGVFDVMMRAVSAHLEQQAVKNRLTGAEYAKVYLGGIHAVMQYGVQFLLGKDRAYWENLQLQAAVRLAQAQEVRAHADIQIARATIQQMAYQVVETRLKAGVARNQYALTKMELVSGYNDALKRENEVKLVGEQYEATRAQTKDTLSTGGAISGLLAVEKLIKLAQKDLTQEQHDTQRAQTKETLLSGLPVEGIAKHEKLLKAAQAQLVGEQYESQRGQTRGTLSTGEVVGGMIGAQTALYQQQITSYKRDAETKALKMVMDTWTARKTIDEGVAVPVQIDTAAIDTMMSTLRTNLQLL